MPSDQSVTLDKIVPELTKKFNNNWNYKRILQSNNQQPIKFV